MCGSSSRAAFLAVLAACSKPDPKACSDRIARFEQRFAGLAPSPVALTANGFDLPHASRERTRAIGHDGIIAVTRYDAGNMTGHYDAGLMTLRGSGAFASFAGTRKQGRPDIDVRDALRSLPSTPASVPLYIIVPEHDHRMLGLVDTFATLDPRFDLRLVVGIDGTAQQAAPSDASDDLRDALSALPGPTASERYSTLEGLLDKAGGGCDGLTKAIAATIANPGPVTGIVEAFRRCGCQTVDVPAVEAIVAVASFAIGQRELGWMPLDLSVTTGTAQQFATMPIAAAHAPEPGLGAPCQTAADCSLAGAACVPFDRDGSWYPGEPSHCTRACGSGCPRGFRCTHEAQITGVDAHGPQATIVGEWCGPVAPR